MIGDRGREVTDDARTAAAEYEAAAIEGELLTMEDHAPVAEPVEAVDAELDEPRARRDGRDRRRRAGRVRRCAILFVRTCPTHVDRRV
jgi:hypothetical protein